MDKLDLVLRGGTVVQPGVGTFQADIGIKNGKIAALGMPATSLDTMRVEDISGLHVFPGVVDPHVHIGLGGGAEEYKLDTASAALGGVTTIFYYLIDKGSYHPVLEAHLETARDRAYVDFAYHPTLMTHEHMEEIPSIMERWGISSFKFFMHFRGDEGLYMGVTGGDDGLLYGMMEKIAANDGVLAVHCENIEIAWLLGKRLRDAGREDLAAWNESRPPFVEAEAVERAALFAAETGCPLYVVHVTAGASLDAVRVAQAQYPHIPIFAETCPHYLTHDDHSEIGNIGKVNPPLRSKDDIRALWDGLLQGDFDTVGSDHVGRKREKKQGTIWQASAGFPGMSTMLPVLITEGYHKRGLPLEEIAELTSRRPAEIYRLNDRKGDIRVGLDADLAVVDLDWERTPDAEWMGTWSDYSIYENWPLKGWSRYTLLRGQIVQQNGEILVEPGFGQYQKHR